MFNIRKNLEENIYLNENKISKIKILIVIGFIAVFICVINILRPINEISITALNHILFYVMYIFTSLIFIGPAIYSIWIKFTKVDEDNLKLENRIMELEEQLKELKT